jgi:hypothetical protein
MPRIKRKRIETLKIEERYYHNDQIIRI